MFLSVYCPFVFILLLIVRVHFSDSPPWFGEQFILKTHLPSRRRGFDPWVGKIPLEKGLATHSSIPAWRIPWTEEPGGLQSTGSQRAGQRLSTTVGLDIVLLWLTLLRVSLRWPLRWAFLVHWKSALWWSPCQKLEGICHCDFDFILFHYTKTKNKEGKKWIFENSGWQAMDIFVILFFITFMHF